MHYSSVPIRQTERNYIVKNRMRESRTSGSVRGEGGNILTYSAGVMMNQGQRLAFSRDFRIT